MNLPVTVSVDASSKGLGAALIQGNGVVCHASRALTPTEQKYAQIELEMLAIVFGCQRFHSLIFGKHDVTVESDHKPLENLHKKPLHSAPLKIQRIMLKLQPYTYTVRYERGTNIGFSDCLSRLPQPLEARDAVPDEFHVCHIDTLTSTGHDSIAAATAHDEELQSVMKVIHFGWPDLKRDTQTLYWDYRDELSVCDGVVFREDRICIPNVLRPQMLRLLHTAHLGIVYTKHKARDIVNWPGLNGQIEDMINKCSTCLEHRNRNQKEPMKSHPAPHLPWSRVSCDLFELYGRSDIVLVDSYSGFIEVEPLRDTSTSTVIKIIKANIARYGIMDILMSDNVW